MRYWHRSACGYVIVWWVIGISGPLWFAATGSLLGSLLVMLFPLLNVPWLIAEPQWYVMGDTELQLWHGPFRKRIVLQDIKAIQRKVGGSLDILASGLVLFLGIRDVWSKSP